MNLAQQFGWTVEQAYEDQGYSMNQLADRVGMSRGYLSEIVRGTKGISLKYALRLASTLDFSLEDFKGVEDTQHESVS